MKNQDIENPVLRDVMHRAARAWHPDFPQNADLLDAIERLRADLKSEAELADSRYAALDAGLALAHAQLDGLLARRKE